MSARGVLFWASLAVTVVLATAKPRNNIVFVLTDDQDLLLNSLDFMPKLKDLMADKGATYNNAFAATPICCPSRSSFTTGRYIHSVGVSNNSVSGNCASPAWAQGPEQHNMATYMKAAGYTTGFMGKYLNQYGFPAAGGVAHIPPGWDEWQALVGNSKYYDYSISNNGVKETFGTDYATDYYPDILANRSLAFISEQTADPFFLMVSMPTCHQPAAPAPQYANMFDGIKAPRTPNWNQVQKDHHWFVDVAGYYGPMNDTVTDFSDLLYRRRLETLQSTDEYLERLFAQLEKQGILDNTYVFYTSDHGYHLGQQGLALDKRLLYETDIRIPFFVRGPGIAAGSVSDDIVLNIDMAPTFVDLAGGDVPSFMDGQSMVPTFPASAQPEAGSSGLRSDFLVEYYGQSNDGGGHPGPCHDKLAGMTCYVNGPTLKPPHYQYPAFCDCQDSANNTYWCVRTLNATTNTIYCEFITGFVEYYDMSSDPWQMDNKASTLSPERHAIMHARLEALRKCEGPSCRALPGAQSSTGTGTGSPALMQDPAPVSRASSGAIGVHAASAPSSSV